MKILKILLMILLFFNFSQLKSDENSEILKNKILKNIRCLVCQGQSVYDSDSDFASSVKLVVGNQLKKGMSEGQIYEFLKE